MELDTGGVLQPVELYTKTKERVMEVLHTKHLYAHPPTLASLDTYPDRPPDIFSVDITNDTVTEVTGRLSGGAWPGGGGVLSETPVLAPTPWCSKKGTTADCCRLFGVVWQRAAPMVLLPSTDERSDDRTVQAARDQAGWGRRNLAEVDGEVCTVGDRTGGQVHLRDRESSWRR